MLDGEVVVDTSEGAYRLRARRLRRDPVGVPHAWRNEGDRRRAGPRWRRRSRAPGHDGDTYVVPPLPEREPVPVDVRDPRTRSFGHIEPENMDPAKQTQDLLAVSASMRTALLVYSGITLKMMVDTDLGAQLSTMFMVQNDAGGGPGPHDHPFEETYLILDGEVDGVFDGDAVPPGARRRRVGRRRLRPLLLEPRARARPVARDAGAAAAGPPFVPVRARLGVPARRDLELTRTRRRRRWMNGGRRRRRDRRARQGPRAPLRRSAGAAS